MFLLILSIAMALPEQLGPDQDWTIRGRLARGAAITSGPLMGKIRVRYYYPTPTPESEFFNWFNHVRAQRGLCAVTHDDYLASWAALNNPPQLTWRCSGHHVNPNVWQIAYYGPWDAQTTITGFMTSPAHAAVVFDPALRSIGIAKLSNAWTVNARR